MFGLLFALPQFFQAVHGRRRAGHRAAAAAGDRRPDGRAPGWPAGWCRGSGAKAAVAAGLRADGGWRWPAGAATGPATGYGYIAVWITAGRRSGIGLDHAAGDGRRARARCRRSAAAPGPALIQALRQVGGAIGVAVLGTVLNAGYRDRVDVAGLPGPAAGAVRDSASGGVAVADRLGAPDLLDSVRAAFTHGMDRSLLVAAAVAVLGAALALLFLPSHPPAPRRADGPPSWQNRRHERLRPGGPGGHAIGARHDLARAA